MRRKNSVKSEPKTCSICGGTKGIYYKARPPYKCWNCNYIEKHPNKRLRLFSESLEKANQGWGKMDAEDYYRAVSKFIKNK